jgi:hypothetical protein
MKSIRSRSKELSNVKNYKNRYDKVKGLDKGGEKSTELRKKLTDLEKYRMKTVPKTYSKSIPLKVKEIKSLETQLKTRVYKIDAHLERKKWKKIQNREKKKFMKFGLRNSSGRTVKYRFRDIEDQASL